MSVTTEKASGEPLVIAFGYRDGILPNAFFRAYKRGRRAMRRASYDVSVELRPLNHLPAHVDVLVIEPLNELPAIGASAIGEIVTADPDQLQAEFDRVIERLVAEGRLTHGPGRARSTAIHRGFRAVVERARLED